jgi:drug/metabolite transporter (DMT)-like permease
MSVPAAYFGVILIWSTTPLAIKWSSEGPGYLFGVSSRMIIGAILCMLFMMILRIRLPWHKDALLTYVAAGTGVFGAMSCVYWGSQFIPSGMVSVLFGLTPIVTGAIAALWIAESSFTPVKVTGMLAGLLGLVFIFGTGIKLGEEAMYGILAVLASVLIHSMSTVWVKRIGAQIPALATTTGALLFALPLYITVWLVFDGKWPAQTPSHAVASIIYLGIFGSALGFMLYYYALKHIAASRMALVTLVTPVIALFLGLWLNNETLHSNVIIGTVLILSGLLFYERGNLFSRKLDTVSATSNMQEE